MKILAIETATEACSAALYLDGEVVEDFRIAPREHARLILGMTDLLLAEAGVTVSGLDAVAFGRGPGAFTGVRIATGVVQGIAFAAELPVVPVSTLAALAQKAYREFGWQKVASAIDARMAEVYWAAYEADEGLMQPVSEERVYPPNEVPLLSGEGWHGIGSGWNTYPDELEQRQQGVVHEYHGDGFPHAQDIARLAAAIFESEGGVSAEAALPVYLRDQVAKKSAK